LRSLGFHVGPKLSTTFHNAPAGALCKTISAAAGALSRWGRVIAASALALALRAGIRGAEGTKTFGSTELGTEDRVLIPWENPRRVKMATANPWRGLGAVEFGLTASRPRAANYRERADHLSFMAQSEPIGKLRAQLTAIADQYDELADSLGKPNDRP